MGGTSRWWGGSRLGKKKKTQCDDPEFRKKLLPLIKEMPFIGLFEDIRGETKYVWAVRGRVCGCVGGWGWVGGGGPMACVWLVCVHVAGSDADTNALAV